MDFGIAMSQISYPPFLYDRLLGMYFVLMEQDYKYSDQISEIISAAMEVHRALGNGFQEVIYQRALGIELEKRKMIHTREVEMEVYYKGIEIGTRRVDFLVNNLICVELKAISKLEEVHLTQALNYLEAYNKVVGLLLNFGAKSLEIKRALNRKYKPKENRDPNQAPAIP